MYSLAVDAIKKKHKKEQVEEKIIKNKLVCTNLVNIPVVLKLIGSTYYLTVHHNEAYRTLSFKLNVYAKFQLSRLRINVAKSNLIWPRHTN